MSYFNPSGRLPNHNAYSIARAESLPLLPPESSLLKNVSAHEEKKRQPNDIVTSYDVTVAGASKLPHTHARELGPDKQERTHIPKPTKSPLFLRRAPEPTLSPEVILQTNTSTEPKNAGGAHLDTWKLGLRGKSQCIKERHALVFLYHMRKAAGTSIRDYLKKVARPGRGVELVETEGISLDVAFLNAQSTRGVVLVTTIRHPVDRVLSLYWYEHVGWWDGVVHDHSRMKTLTAWVDHWEDGSAWKQKFGSANPRSVYVEIQNYFIKSLIGWKGPGFVSVEDLALAKDLIGRFDVVLVTEFMKSPRQTKFIQQVFGVKDEDKVAVSHQLKGDDKAKQRLKSTLASDLELVKDRLTVLNALDIKLFEYASALAAARMDYWMLLSGVTEGVSCEVKKTPVIARHLTNQLRIHRPPGHKQ